MKKIILMVMIMLAFASAGCTRVETGEVGLRLGYDKQIQTTELQPGTFNQVLVGDVLLFPVKQIGLSLDNIKPQTSDNSTLADMDLTVIYNINPISVGDIYTKESRSFHALNEHGETLLMYNYLMTVANSAAFKAVNGYAAKGIASHRGEIEVDTLKNINAALKDKGLETEITIAQVQVKNLLPDASIINSANAVITQQNALLAKQIEVDIASKEAQRLAMLSSNSQNISYMHAKALSDIAEGVKAGTVHSIIIPMDFKGIVNAN